LGHKVHPNAFRLGAFRSWEANWFATDKDYTKLLHEDLEMRRVILGRLRNAGIAKIETERSSNAQMTVTIHTAKPGIVIGKGGASVDQLREELERRFQNRVRISIQEIKQPELDAQLVAENIASQIERRISYRRAMKQSILRTMRAGAKGVRIALGGRLRGSEMARREWDREGRVPLQTLRADIDFGRATAKTTFGSIGVKCWIYKDLLKPRRRGGEAEEEQVVAPQPEATVAASAAPVATEAAAPVAAEPAAGAVASAPGAEAPSAPVADAVAQPEAVSEAPTAALEVEAPSEAPTPTAEVAAAPEAAAPEAAAEASAAKPARKRATAKPAAGDEAPKPARRRTAKPKEDEGAPS
jgi:small subunit ribosomal protein S3